MAIEGGSQNFKLLPVGYVLHRQYRIEKVLGNGGFGITYLAYDMRIGRQVSIKELFPNNDVVRDQPGGPIRVVEGQEEFFAHLKKRFLEEAEMLYRFQSIPDIVNVYQYFEENNTAYYVMEYLVGTDLRNVLKQRGTFSWEELSGYVSMILQALYAIHAGGLIHRDISPDNIFLTQSGRAVLIDFGSVRAYQDDRGLTTILKERFAPYEQYQSKGNQGPWTDVYALSVTIYYLLTGILVQKAPERLMGDKTVPLSTLLPDLPANVSAAVEKGMSVRPQDRFQTVEAFYAALFPSAGSSKPRQSSDPPKKNTGERIKRQRSGGQASPGKERRHPRSGQASGPVKIACVQGYYHGKARTFQAGEMVTMGRLPECVIRYPNSVAGISRMQCTMMLDRQGRLYLRDENSTYGTYLNGKKLPGGKWIQVFPGNKISFGMEIYQVI